MAVRRWAVRPVISAILNFSSGVASYRTRRMTDYCDESDRKQWLFDYKKNRDWTENLTIIMQLGLTMAGCIVFCLFIGRLIEQWLALKGVFTTIFILLGIIGGANVCYRQIMEITDPKKEDDSDDHSGTRS